MTKILLVEDDRVMAEGIKDALSSNGFEVVHSITAEEGEMLLSDEEFHMVLLDVKLPGKDGFEMCQGIRKRGMDLPVIMLTAKTDEVDKVVGLELGADDYVTKPFGTRELIARVRAHLRRGPHSDSDHTEYHFGDIKVDFKKYQVFRNGREEKLTSTEFALLKLLIEERNNVLSREKILSKIWGYTSYPDSRIVDVHILNLRKKLERDSRNPEFIKTFHGVGYQFVG